MFPRDPAVVERDVVLRVASDRKRFGPKDDVAAVVAFAHGDGGLRRTRLLAEKLLAVEDHRVARLDRTERLGVR